MTEPTKETNPKPSKVYAAFVAAWSTIRTLEHDSANPHFKARYTSYDRIMQALRPILADNKLAVIQLPEIYESRATLHTVVLHNDGGKIDLGTIAVPVKKDNDPQAFGSALTYAKRYALCAAFGIPTGDDDDANAAAASPPQITKAAAMGAINKWSGMSGKDATEAAKQVVELAGTTDPQKLIDYVNAHKGEDFITHTSKEATNA